MDKQNRMEQAAAQDKRSRYLGCLLGGAVGDALGYPIEFWSEDRIFQRCGPQNRCNASTRI